MIMKQKRVSSEGRKFKISITTSSQKIIHMINYISLSAWGDSFKFILNDFILTLTGVKSGDILRMIYSEIQISVIASFLK